MTQITAAQVKELRDLTNVSMGECKKALVKTEGNKDEAIKLLRELGLAMADKKSGRAAEQGLLASVISEDSQKGSLVEVNCETDFVAKNPDFIAFVNELAVKAVDVPEGQLADVAKDDVAGQVATIGENIVLKRNLSFEVDGTGALVNYIHLGGQVAVVMELGFENADTAQNDDFKNLGKDLCMHVAATSPQGISREDVDPAIVEEERAIYAKQMEGKPAEILEKIITGKIEKFFSQICMLEQGFVKDPDVTVKKLIEDVGSKVGDTITLRRFTRTTVGA